jgi:hypothetical protein
MGAPPPGYGQQSYPPYLYPRPDASEATPSLIFGILSLAVLPLGCCCGIGLLVALPLGVAGVVFGFMARNKIAASQGALGGDGKALGGIVTGGTALFVVVALGAVEILGFALPSLINGLPSPHPS